MFHSCVLDGDPNASFLHDVWSNIDQLSEAKEDIVLDLSRVDFMESHGVGAVVDLIRRLGFKGLQLKVTGLHGQPLRLFLDLHLVPVSGVPGNSRTSTHLPELSSELASDKRTRINKLRVRLIRGKSCRR